MSLISLGVNHNTAPLSIREGIAGIVQDEQWLKDLLNQGFIEELVVVSTCNRVEVYSVVPDQFGLDGMLTYLESSGIPLDTKHLYTHQGVDVVHHLFRVVTSLDSMILGETQIVSQVKNAYQEADKQQRLGPILRRFFEKAFMVAKKVRTETKISEGSVSIGRAGVELVVQVLGELENSKALVVGAGEHGQLVANNLIQQHLTDLTFANRTLSRAIDLSKELGGTTVKIQDIPSILYKMDVIVSSIGGGQQIIRKSEVAKALKLRSYKPMIFIDLSVPRVFDIAIHDLEDAYLFDVDDLKGLTDETEQKRIQEADLAEGIINEEVRLCWEILHDNQYNRNIGNVFQKAQEIVESEVVRLEQQLDLSSNHKEKIQKSMQSLVRKLYHHPIRHLHHLAKKDLEGEIQELLNILLGVESDEEE